MSLGRLPGILLSFYAHNDPGHREDHAERLAQRALALAAKDAPGRANMTLVEALARLLPVRDAMRHLKARGAIEAGLVELGWTDPQLRDLWRALERLPDKPQALEEQIVADADTLARLGPLGLVQEAVRGGAGGKSIDECLEAVHQSLGKRLYTASAQALAGPLKRELRELWLAVKKQLDSK